MKTATLERHKHLLEGDGTEDELWAKAGEFTNNCCFDEKKKYALIKKTSGRKCGPDVDCDKVVERKAPHAIFDLVGGAGAPGARPIFDRAHNHDGTPAFGTPEDFAEPQEYSEKPEPVPDPVIIPVLPLRDEMMSEGTHLHNVYKRELKRPEGLWKDGAPDMEGICAWLLDVYIRARLAGKSRDEARAAYMNDIRNSDEWKANNPR